MICACTSGPQHQSLETAVDAPATAADTESQDSTDRVQRPSPGHTDLVQSVDISADGAFVASAGVDGLVKVWDVETRRVLAEFEHHCEDPHGEPSVYSVALSADASQVAVACTSEVRLWMTEGPDEPRTIEVVGTDDAPSRYAVEFGPKAARIATVSWEKNGHGVRVWDVESGRLEADISGYGPVAFSPDGASIAVNVEKPADEMSDKEKRTIALNALLTPRYQNRVALYDLEIESRRMELEGRALADDDITFDQTGSLVAATNGSTVTVWDTSTGEPKVSTTVDLTGSAPWSSGEAILTVAFGPDGDDVYVASQSGSISRIALSSGAIEARYSRPIKWGSGDEVVRPVDHADLFYFREKMFQMSPDARRLVSAPGGATVFVWDVESGQRRTLE